MENHLDFISVLIWVLPGDLISVTPVKKPGSARLKNKNKRALTCVDATNANCLICTY